MNTPKCEQCGTEMVLRTKGSDKFWGCPNYKECGGKTLPYEGENSGVSEETIKYIGDSLGRIERMVTEMWEEKYKIKKSVEVGDVPIIDENNYPPKTDDSTFIPKVENEPDINDIPF